MDLGSFNTIDWIALGVVGALFLIQLYWYSRYLAAPARRMRKDKKAKAKGQEIEKQQELPGVTVILAAHNECVNLSNYLQALLTQEYPTYEVIVVDDGSEDSTRDVVEQYMHRDPRLKMTFVPHEARVGSTKKLAITLAAKAAQYEYLLLTDADCVPESSSWIREMMKGFGAEQKDIVLGFSPYFEDKGHINRLVRFDTLFNGLHYLGAALCGHPYMGVGRNLAYRKRLFFESGGFSHLMTNKAGDDDLFVNHVATRSNTAVVLSRESYMWSTAKQTMKEWWQQKRRHLSVSPAYITSTKWRLGVEPMTRGLFYAAVLLILVGYGWQLLKAGTIDWLNPGFLVPAVALGLFLLRWIIQTTIINVSARRMGLRRFSMMSVLWFDIALPLVNLWMLAVPLKKQYKW